MNFPNKLTVSRIGLTFVMAVFLTFPSIPFGKSLALLFFVAASITDYWDGWLARRIGGVTAFGKLMDPLADKILVCAAFVSFAAIRQIVPAWVVIAIISREFLVTGLRMLGASSGQIIPAGMLGKQKTIWQIAVIIVIMVGLAVQEDLLPRLPPSEFVQVMTDAYRGYFNYLTYGLSAMAAILTVASGMVYLWQSRELFVKDL